VHRPTLVLVLVALALCGCGARGQAADGGGAGRAVVVRPVDGDTIIARVGGREVAVRLIGIDTPESVARDRPVECFGPEAKSRAAALLPPGTAIRLERDVEPRDRYDRLLAYVVRDADDLFVNRALVEEGLAEAVAYPPNLARQAELEQAETRARAAARGLWPACGGTDVPIAPG
jgi:micrococcal nuclease